jgi:hypothetical protein
VRASLLGYWRVFKLLLVNSRQRMDLLFLHLPQEQVAQLKLLAADGNAVPGITTGDAVQAACGLLVHTALGKPLLPVAPQAMMVLVQMPTPAGYFGNAAHMLRVSLPEGTAQPAAGDYAGALKQLAGAIRSATAAFRSQPVRQCDVVRGTEVLFGTPPVLPVLPSFAVRAAASLNSCPAAWLQEGALKALADSEALVAAPAPRMLSFLARTRLPLLTCTTNYVPTQKVNCNPAAAATAVPACAGCCRRGSPSSSHHPPEFHCPATSSAARPCPPPAAGLRPGAGPGACIRS